MTMSLIDPFLRSLKQNLIGTWVGGAWVALGLAGMPSAALPAEPGSAAPAALSGTAVRPSGPWVTIHNDFYWVDQDGARILTRSGCLDKFNGVFYWYGGNPRGFREQYCYTSTDLIHWTNHGVILRHDVDANRIDVQFNDATRQYVMFLKYNGNGAHLAWATAEKPEGPFTFKSQTLVDDARMGDMSVFKDDDGKAYLAYVSWAVGVNAQHGVYRFSEDYLSLDQRLYLWDIRSREANHIFKRNALYYYGTSRTAGIASSETTYYTATNLAGPWSPARRLNTPGSSNSWDSQVDFVYPLKGTEGTLYMFCGDRWTKNLPQGRNGDYIWLPMEFEGDVPTVNYYQDWELNPGTGAWRKFDPARNLAAGRTATASSEIGTNVAGKVTEAHTYQNYIHSHWDSATNDPQWLMVDLGAAKEVNRVILKWNVNAAKDFKIQTSRDGSAWTDAFSTTKASSYSVTDETFPTTTARYVRMYAPARAPVPVAGRGRGRGGARLGTPGRGPQTNSAPATQTNTQSIAEVAPTIPTNSPPATEVAPAPQLVGYSLFEFEVLRD